MYLYDFSMKKSIIHSYVLAVVGAGARAGAETIRYGSATLQY
jgi:hypothetical protein